MNVVRLVNNLLFSIRNEKNTPQINQVEPFPQPYPNLELREVKQKLPKDCSKKFTYCM